MGVLGDFSGNPEVPLARPRDRKFVSVDPDNFDEVLEAMAPRATFRVRNSLTGEGEFGVELKFKSIDDFGPEAVVQQVEPLRKLHDARARLADLRNKLAGNEKLEDLLNEVLSNTNKLQRIRSENGGDSA